jgi:hypothetical protein
MLYIPLGIASLNIAEETLATIAVGPYYQGQGFGSGETCGEHVRLRWKTCLPGIIQSQKISIYERHGFEVVGDAQVGDCPVFCLRR